MLGTDAYTSAIAAARARGLVLSEAQADVVAQLLRDHVGDLAERMVRELGKGRSRTARLALRNGLEGLVAELEAQLRGGVLLTARTVAEMHTRATVELLAANGAAADLVEITSSAMARVGLRTFQAVAARPELSAAMASIRRDAIEAADQVLLRGMLRGGSPEAIGRALRLQLVGADAFPPAALRDLRTIGYGTLEAMGLEATPANLAAVKRQAAKIAERAALIARTEVMAAEHEAGTQADVESPVVGLLEWVLSGRHTAPDECDCLAEVDFYGHGPGLYLPEQFPARPHPRCLCNRRHHLRPPAEWGTKRQPPGALVAELRDVAGRYGFTPSRGAGLARAIGGAPQHHPRADAPRSAAALPRQLLQPERELVAAARADAEDARKRLQGR